MKAFIRRSDLSRDRAEQRPERFSVGNKLDARVTSIDAKTRKLGLSIKAREIAEEKEAVEQYGSSDSGASLGDILASNNRYSCFYSISYCYYLRFRSQAAAPH